MLGIVNSDARMNMVYQKMKSQTECILLDDFSNLGIKFDAIVLPMSGLKDNDTMVIRGIEVHFPLEFLEMLKEDGVLIVGNMTKKTRELSPKKIYLNDYDQFIHANSKLTAEGVLFLLLDNSNYGLLDQAVDLIGYGHAGKAIYEILKRMGVPVRVIRRNVTDHLQEFVSVQEYQTLKPHPVIINTSIVNIIDDTMIKKMDENLIINIVGNQVFNEALLRARHCRIVHAGPLPAMFAARSAANVLVDVLQEIL